MERNLIIVEGAQGVGKGTITTALRNRLTCTNLMSLAGLPIGCSAEEVMQDRKAEMRAVLHTDNVSWILDRSYITDLVYQRMGKKPYTYEDFNIYNRQLGKLLAQLATNYNICLVLLKATEEEFTKRLVRPNKPVYENMTFAVESSMTQQKIYEEEFDKLEAFIKTQTKQPFKVLKIDTTSNPEDTISYIMEAINVKEK